MNLMQRYGEKASMQLLFLEKNLMKYGILEFIEEISNFKQWEHNSKKGHIERHVIIRRNIVITL